MSSESSTSFIVACIQTHPQIMDVEGNLARQRPMIEEAIGKGAKLIVLPECSTTGWVFKDAAEARSVAELVPGGPTCNVWQEYCTKNDVHIVAGIVEVDGDDVYNTAVLLGPKGFIGKFRKMHLWSVEKNFYTPGDLGLPVFETPLGRIGMHICYDGWFNESYRLLALAKADILCVPANWVPVPTQKKELPVMANLLCMTNAHTNLVYIAAASRVGVERGQPFIGRSIVVDHAGWPLAGPASGENEEIIYAEVDPIGSRSEREGNPFNQPLGDRRTDAYEVVTHS